MSVNTVGTVLAVRTVGHGEGGGGAVGEIDRVDVLERIGRAHSRTGDGGDTAAVLAGSAVLAWGAGSTRITSGAGITGGTLCAVNSVAQHEGLRNAAGGGDGDHIAGVGGEDNESRHVGSLFGVQGVGHTHHLLNARHRVVVAAVRVDFGLQEVGAAFPSNVGKDPLLGVPVADLKGHEAVGVCGDRMGLHIHGDAGFRALQHAHAHTHVGVRH